MFYIRLVIIIIIIIIIIIVIIIIILLFYYYYYYYLTVLSLELFAVIVNPSLMSPSTYAFKL